MVKRCQTILLLIVVALSLWYVVFALSKIGQAGRIVSGNRLITQGEAIRIGEAYVDEMGCSDNFPRFRRCDELLGLYFPVIYSVRVPSLEPQAVSLSAPSSKCRYWVLGFRECERSNRDSSILNEHYVKSATLPNTTEGIPVVVGMHGESVYYSTCRKVTFSDMDRRLRR